MELPERIREHLEKLSRNLTEGEAKAWNVKEVCKEFGCLEIEFFAALAEALETMRDDANAANGPDTWDPVIGVQEIILMRGPIRNFREGGVEF